MDKQGQKSKYFLTGLQHFYLNKVDALKRF